MHGERVRVVAFIQPAKRGIERGAPPKESFMTPPLIRIAAIFLMSLAAACASSRTLSGSVADLAIDADLKATLFADRSYDYSDVDLTVYDGRLMLTGTMLSDEGHRKLIENAWKADGVKQVVDEIQVADHTSLGQGLEDTRIDQTIRTKFMTSGDIRSANYKIAVSRGVVYLLGVARDEKELNKAIEAARTVSGVEAVVSHVVYRPMQ